MTATKSEILPLTLPVDALNFINRPSVRMKPTPNGQFDDRQPLLRVPAIEVHDCYGPRTYASARIFMNQNEISQNFPPAASQKSITQWFYINIDRQIFWDHFHSCDVSSILMWCSISYVPVRTRAHEISGVTWRSIAGDLTSLCWFIGTHCQDAVRTKVIQIHRKKWWHFVSNAPEKFF